MPTPEEQKTVNETLETRRQIEEIVGEPVGTVKTDYNVTDEEYEKKYEEMREQRQHTLEQMKKYRPLSLGVGILLFAVGIVLIVLNFVLNTDLLLIGIMLSFLGAMSAIVFSPKLMQKSMIKNMPSKEDYFDVFCVAQARAWLNEAKENNYYLDLQEQALNEKYGKGINGPTWSLLGKGEVFTVIRITEKKPVYSCFSFQRNDITGIAIQTRVNETSKSVSTENKWYNDYVGSRVGNKYTTETSVTQTKEYAISLTFNNRFAPYSFYIGKDSNLLLSVVNLLERTTGLQAKYI